MLLRPSNTLILDEPTNHLDLESKDVLLEALEDFGGTLIFVSHDRYFVDKLATKVVDIGHGDALLYPGNYEEFLWSRKQQMAAAAAPELDPPAPQKPAAIRAPAAKREPAATAVKPSSKADAQVNYGERKRLEAEARRDKKAADAKRRRVEELEARIADRERAIREIEEAMSAPGFYEDHESARPVIDRHQALMWEVGDLMNQWEALQTEL
jgi:ATP-binding cassette subfamily F protein 3